MSKFGGKGVIAAGHALTAQAGAAVLRRGGNAVDAAIAAAWMTCACEPIMGSPGGGGFAMVGREGEEPVLYDFFVQTPRRKQPGAEDFREVHANFGSALQAFHIGQASAAAPGFVPGLFALHQDLATWDMPDLAAPATTAAREGFPIAPFQAQISQVVKPIITDTPGVRALYLPGDGGNDAGRHFANPGMARFIDLVARRDGASWHRGEVLEALCEQQDRNGHLCEEDFTAYEVVRRPPLWQDFAGARLALNPPPSGGGVFIAEVLGKLDGNDRPALTRVLHATDEIWRDPDSPLRQRVDRAHDQATRGTTHLSVIDGAGQMVSMTLTNGEGTGRLVGDFGFMLNNMLGEDDVNPHGAIGWTPNRRLSSTMCPTLALCGDGGAIALGAGGSSRIRSTISHVLMQRLLNEQPLSAAVSLPRVHVENNHLDCEDSGDAGEMAKLEGLLTSWRAWEHGKNMYFGGCNAVERNASGVVQGTGDPRRQGVCLAVQGDSVLPVN